jgi:hypothetical protein
LVAVVVLRLTQAHHQQELQQVAQGVLVISLQAVLALEAEPTQ